MQREGRDVEVGTPAEIGARSRMRDVSAAASYLSSLPKGDKYLSQTTGEQSPFADVTSKAQQGLSAAQTEYAKALSRVDEKPAPAPYETPEWAKSTIEEGMPGLAKSIQEVAASLDKTPPPAPAPRQAPKEFIRFCDERLKENIVELSSQWENIKGLRPVEFDYIESEGGDHQIGFIAQDVEKIYPDVVAQREDGMLMIEGMSKQDARMVKALQEAMERIEALEAELSALKSV